MRFFKLFSLTILLSICLNELTAQGAKKKKAEEAPKVVTESDKEKQEQEILEKEKKEKDKKELEKYYARLKYPPGFYEGAFLISFMGGTSLASGGSFISHEKVYDERLQGKIITN